MGQEYLDVAACCRCCWNCEGCPWMICTDQVGWKEVRSVVADSTAAFTANSLKDRG